VQEYPKSANTYDSLGEAYLKMGQKDLAIRNYETSLRLDPDVLAWFRSHGKGYQTRINAVLRAYMKAHTR